MIDFSKMILPETIEAERKSKLIDSIANRRYLAEISGITINGLNINTERESQSMITGAALSAFMDSGYVCRWKTPTGFVDLDAPTLIAISIEMRKHVQACFDREAVLLEELEAGTFIELMLEEGWPQ